MSKKRLLPMGMTALLAACGGGGSVTTPPVGNTPPTTLAPSPAATPTPSPSATPCPDGSCGNHNAVVRSQLRLYLLLDDKGNLVTPTPDPVRQVLEQPIPVGYTLRLDVAGRDANGDETDGKGQIVWHYSGEDLIDTNMRTPWMRDITVVKPGQWSVYVTFDGVDSNSILFTFQVFK
jgi:hypothetical protein